ncbi:hypothetical protein L226DRAFT_239902 [Lentinus tigrinus ALCF2SS1-7]|uniref:uncharacterized protein n=1 Tax=Lentinus tigrinus ALCF2SS1-7 TaxID=1328758 RepID=UPI00116610E5|nr:hypothetical protein L226DRAFT_239902 [Lentinus tigrinus ALCF2SS1-7]
MASSLFYVLFASLFAVVCAQNLPPPIIVPKTGDVWKAGERQTVKWSIDGINVYDPGLNPLRGKIFIGHLTNNSRYIWFTEPLASDFTYLQQQVDIIVPTFPTAHNYFLVSTIGASSSPLRTLPIQVGRERWARASPSIPSRRRRRRLRSPHPHPHPAQAPRRAYPLQ